MRGEYSKRKPKEVNNVSSTIRAIIIIEEEGVTKQAFDLLKSSVWLSN